jgi:hypothetical protein
MWWGVAAGTVAIAAIFVASGAVHHTETVARQNETRAQLISDQYESFYAIYAAQLLESGSRTTNAQLEPDAVARAHQIQFGTPNSGLPGYSGSSKLLERDEGLGSTWVSIEVDVTYPEAFGGHGALATCYDVSIPASPKTSAPVTSFEPSCPRRGEGPLPYPSATS